MSVSWDLSLVSPMSHRTSSERNKQQVPDLFGSLCVRVEDRAIQRFVEIELCFVSSRIEIGIGAALPELRVFLGHVVHPRMGTERDIARERAARLERTRVLFRY